MAGKFGQDIGSNQLWWVILLLAVAVILPTVCLLWFMTQAVKNERLAMRQKLSSLYYDRLEEISEEKLSFEYVNDNTVSVICDGFLVFDKSGILIYPAVDVDENIILGDTFAYAFIFEYQMNDPRAAMGEYRRISESSDSDEICIAADVSLARCLNKLGRVDEAIIQLRELLSAYGDEDKYVRVQKCRAHIMLLELCRQSGEENFRKELSDTFNYATRGMITDNGQVFPGPESDFGECIPSSVQLFVLNRIIDYTNDINDTQFIEMRNSSERLIQIVSTSLMVLQEYGTPISFAEPGAVFGGLFRLDTEGPLYGIYERIGDYTYLIAFKRQRVIKWFDNYLKDVQELPSRCRIYDEDGRFVAGSRITDGEPFIRAQLDGKWFRNWIAELYIEDDAFEDAAGRQAAVYIWAGMLVVLLILTSGAIAAKAVGRQIKLNRLKNVFIATVTHELKTPLSSMRVLVDTLLEGNYEGEQTVNEYLRLISRENERLSHLMDNFLTFSRMERNKQAFEISPVSPVEIANAAADAVRAKFDMNNVRFNVSIGKPLPMIRADKDAMVTVLVNLLDNSYKYSGNDKSIELRVCSGNGSVCFSVKDNGIGMTRRQIRKAFDRFYQADTSLARRAEGAGLGLSIVKFIVDAHNGKVTIVSKPQKGSRFTVKLKALPGNGNHINN